MRYPMLAIAVWFAAAASAAAQTPLAGPGQPGWSRTDEGCFVWNAKPSTDETVSWTGGCANGRASGTGVRQWKSGSTPGSRYSGTMVDGKEEGHGTLTYSNGDQYDGEWQDGKPNGPGIFVTPTGVIRGKWKDGCFDDGVQRAWVAVDHASCP